MSKMPEPNDNLVKFLLVTFQIYKYNFIAFKYHTTFVKSVYVIFYLTFFSCFFFIILYMQSYHLTNDLINSVKFIDNIFLKDFD